WGRRRAGEADRPRCRRIPAALRPGKPGGECRGICQDAERQHTGRSDGHARGGTVLQRQPRGAAIVSRHADPHHRAVEMSTIPTTAVSPSAAADAYGRVDRGEAGKAAGDFGATLQRALGSAVDEFHTAEAKSMQALTGGGNLTEVVTA